MVQDAGGELAGGQGHVELLTGLVEGVGIAFEQAQVRVHAGTGRVGQGLGHEAGVNATLQGNLLDHRTECHDVVGHGERVRVSQIDLVLAWPRLMVRVFHRDAHLLEHVHGGTAEVHAWAARHVVEVAALVDRGRGLGPVVLAFEQVELDFRMHVEREALVLGFGERALQHVTWIAERRLAVRGQNVAEHAGGTLRATAPRQDLERRGIGLNDHIVFGHAGHALDGGTVEAETLLKRGFQFGRSNRHGLQCSQHVREPQTNKAHVAFFDRAQRKLLLFIHSRLSFHNRVTKGVNISLFVTCESRDFINMPRSACQAWFRPMPARHYGSDYERRSSHPIRQSARRRDQLDAGHRPRDRSRAGIATRTKAPLDAHAIWKVKEGRREAISLLEEQSAIRVPDLIPLRYKRMSASPFTFYRGTVLIMTNDLASTPVTGIPVQCVGDAHIGNFGIFRSPSPVWCSISMISTKPLSARGNGI